MYIFPFPEVFVYAKLTLYLAGELCVPQAMPEKFQVFICYVNSASSSVNFCELD